MDNPAETFQKHRRKLYGIAYRMLGSRSDAEDMVQEAYLRWHRTDAARVEAPEAWLTTTTTRLCIDRLRAARAEREAYKGPWLPEPLVGDEEAFPSPERHVELASDLSVAFLVLLEQLAPEERAAFLLHDVFDCDYPQIAGILGKNEAACRQVVHRARERVRRDRPRFQVSEAAHRRLAEKFVAAMQTADQGALLSLFADDVTWTADGGGKAPAVTKTVQGGARVAKLVGGFARLIARGDAGTIAFEVVPINGQAGVLARRDGRPLMALSFETDGVHILAGYNVTNPEKLARITNPDTKEHS
ncbi:MAG TPA: RNA polymerase sigma-70 factor [Usitatibacter sp.]|nr:RNA polymerase sigma-70 factor [Usitatibacter sp.]